MRKYAIIIVSIVFSILLLNNCKKGENDPFFSIHSRKARMVADWDIDSKSSLITWVLDNGETAIVDFQITGKTTVTEDVDSINHAPDDTLRQRTGEVYEGYYHFNKDGSMEYILHYNLVDDSTYTDDGTGETTSRIITTIYKERASGTWNFMHKIDDYKKKERISMVWESYNTSVNVIYKREVTDGDGIQLSIVNWTTFSATENKYANGESAEVWEINQLKNKEIILQRNVDRVYVQSDQYAGSKTTAKGFESILLTRETGGSSSE